MTQYAMSPSGSGLIMPETIARQVITEAFGGIGGGFGLPGMGGNPGAYRSAGAGNKNTVAWATSDGSADADQLADLATLRQQSRDLVRNDALPAGAINTMVVGVVGQGIIPQSRLDHEYLGITEEQATAWSREAERIFNHVASKATFDSEGRLNFWQQQRLVYRSKLESGDVFPLRRFIERQGKALGVCVQVVEADRVTTPMNKATAKNIRAGVEFDANGAPVKYHVMQQHPGEALTAATDFTEIPAYDQRGDPLILPVLTRLRPGQTRGVPHLAPVIEMFKQLGRYSEAEISAAVISAMFAVFVKSPGAGTSGSPLGGMGHIPGQVLSPQIAPTGNGIQKLQSGMIVDLLPGEEIEIADAKRPNTAFEPFINAALSYIGTALGLPRDVLAKSYNSSYSAARAALQDAFRSFLIERDDLNFQFNAPVWSWVITEAVARGMLKAPGFFDDPMKRDAWLASVWIGSPMQSLDPTKDAKAAAEWMALGIKSKQDVCVEQGTDFDSTLAQRAKEKSQEQAAGVWIDPNPTPPAPAEQNDPPPPADPATKPSGSVQAAISRIEEMMASAAITDEAGRELIDTLEAA